MTITLDALKDAIDNMYSQLDPNSIGDWAVDGLEICVDGEMFVINLEAAE